MTQDPILDQLETQRNEILAAMQSMAGADPEPGEVKVGEVVPTEGVDAQMIVSGIKGAGIAYIYDNRTGERSRTNKNMLPTQLSKKREDGSQVFTMTKPAIEPVRGQLKCMLHPDDPNRELYDSWGLTQCTKSNMPSLRQVRMHMQHRHPGAWETIELYRQEQEKAEDRKLQHAIMRSAAQRNTEADEPRERSRKAG